ncbi:discoidin domain-containing protein [Streptomyces sp. NBC_00193]|uniref:discoidin domain-containing protein n=2 Tax=unclassified Streptomyces TaxID=2593676 RepID=UPI00202FB98B|nr:MULTISPECIES: discoidin domain-containing protein [unclassified Streptomyces]MCM1972244.1 discoidin domain-containing protein [Streptomyces sp. G1]MCX5129623.1 discoidin domain-containing protein [Streptomyces sp. NBC_00347]MCX5300702.1 discoidin domain-containing protein [Streptomyces sp. NBC_00193]
MRLNTPSTPHVYTSRRTMGVVITAVLLLVGGLLLAYPERAGAAADPLISRGKTATASSVETSSFGPQNAFDGSSTTRWASIEGKDPQWIRVDLGANATVSRVALRWEAAYAKTYRVEISADGTTWTRLANETAGNGGTDDWTGLSGTGRYLRVYGTARGTSYGYSLYEVEVYGTLDGGTPPPAGAFTVVAAGDIAAQCTASDSSCAHPKTAAQAQKINPKFYLTMGDNQYDDARLSDYKNYYDKSWGAFKDKTRPVPGNHETYDPAGPLAGYKAYFGAVAYPQGKSYYSFDEGNWHFIALDSNSFDQKAQIDWLKADLAANSKGCIAAYWHHPLYSSGGHGNDPVSKPVWNILYGAKADLVLNGHDHHYERFAPQDPNGNATADGITEIVGGMGGADPYDIETVQPNSQKRISGTYGVLKLDFTDTGYSYSYVATDGTTKDTSPKYTCH